MNKKAGVSFKVTMILFLALSVSKIHIVFAEEGKIDTTKVERFINEVGNFARSGYDSVTLWFDKTKQADGFSLIKTLSLNDEEYFEVERIISEQVDVRYFIGGLGPLNEEHTYEDFVKCSVFTAAFYNQMRNWDSTLTKEEIIMNKIMPIIKKGNNRLKIMWLIKLERLLRDIHNQKVPFLDENRAKVMDELIKIFSNKSNPEELRIKASNAWACDERREEKGYEGFNVLLQDENVFEKIGLDLWFMRKKAPQINEKMFAILENRDKYSDRVIRGTLAFFRRDSMQSFDFENKVWFWYKEEAEGLKRLKKALEKIVGEKGVEEIKQKLQRKISFAEEAEEEMKKQKEFEGLSTQEQIIEESKEILFYIEQKEKEGAYR